MNKNQVTRRQFIQTSSVGTTALLVGARQAVSANDKVRLGFIRWADAGPNCSNTAPVSTTMNSLPFATSVLNVWNAPSISPNRKTRIPKVTPTLKMLEQEQLDGVIVATEVGNHAEVVIPVLEAGLNCFSEKPIEANVEKVDQVVKAARKAKGIFVSDFSAAIPTFHKTIETARATCWGTSPSCRDTGISPAASAAG